MPLAGWTASVVVGAAVVFAPFGLQPHGGKAPEKREVLVNVLDRNGDQRLDLTATNFRGQCYGRPVAILSASLETRPRRIALVVDVSESIAVQGAAPWNTAHDLVSVLIPSNAVGILTLGAQLDAPADVSSDPEVLKQALHRARAAGYSGLSALYSGLQRVTRAAGASWDVGDVVTVITDGEDTASMVNDKDSTADIVGTGVRVFVIWLQPLRPGSDAAIRARYWVQNVTEATGGYMVSADKHLPEALRILASLITQVYRLEVVFPHGLDRPDKWKLTAVGEDGKELKGVRLVYPRLVGPSERQGPAK